MDEEVKCPKCPKMMVMTKITDHVSHQHYNKLDFICNLCTQTFRKSVQFRKHIRDEHPENVILAKYIFHEMFYNILLFHFIV